MLVFRYNNDLKLVFFILNKFNGRHIYMCLFTFIQIGILQIPEVV